ncbi:hypothetical protein EHM92_01565 [bacterium]|nr:MAG: hypothetical protein EHM92_01565 [bacterium]
MAVHFGGNFHRAAVILGFFLWILPSPSAAQVQHQLDSLKQREIILQQEIRELQCELDALRKQLYHAATNPLPVPIPDELRGNENVQYGFPGGDGAILDKQYFVILYDTRLKIPRWVGYHLTREYLEENNAPRTDKFKPDSDLSPDERAELEDYKGSGFDRGHQAPAADFHRSEEAMAETFLLSNICPQWPSFNRGIWARLEEQVRAVAENEGSIWVYTGTLFLDDQGRKSGPGRFIGPDSVAVPTHFFKVVLVERAPADHEMFAFIMKNQPAKVSDAPSRYQVTVDSVQRVSGLDFFDVLPDAEERRLERRIDGQWLSDAVKR